MGECMKWSTTHIEFLKDNHDRFNYSALSNLMGRSSDAIRHKAKELGLKSRFNGNKSNDLTFLNDASIESFYWMGFLIADGTFDAKMHGMRLRVSQVDRPHIQQLADRIKTTLKEGHRSGYTGDSSLVGLNAYDTTILPKLANRFDIRRNKTENPPNFKLYNFSDDEILAILIGFIDGDGCVYVSPRGHVRISILIHPTWRENLRFINTFIHSYFKLASKTEPQITRSGYAYLCLSRKIIIDGLSVFIKNNNLPVLKRKWGKIPH